MIRQLSFLLTLLCLSSTSFGDEIYKWRDNEGKLHFSSTPRVLGPQVEEVDIKPMPADRSNAYRQRYLLQQQKYELQAKERDKERTLNKQKAMLLQEEREKEMAKAQAIRDQKMCEKYKERYKRYRDQGVMGYNIATGEKKIMHGDSARRVIQNTKETMELFCQ